MEINDDTPSTIITYFVPSLWLERGLKIPFGLGSQFGGERQGSEIGAGAAIYSSQWREGEIRHFGGKSDSSLYIRPIFSFIVLLYLNVLVLFTSTDY